MDGDESAGGDAAEWVFARFAGAEEEGESVAAAELQPGRGAQAEGGEAVGPGRPLDVAGQDLPERDAFDEDERPGKISKRSASW